MANRKKARGYDTHHRKPRCRDGDNSAHNTVVVLKHHHRAFHLLFGTMTPEQIAQQLNEIWIDPTFMLVCKRRE